MLSSPPPPSPPIFWTGMISSLLRTPPISLLPSACKKMVKTKWKTKNGQKNGCIEGWRVVRERYPFLKNKMEPRVKNGVWV